MPSELMLPLLWPAAAAAVAVRGAVDAATESAGRSRAGVPDSTVGPSVSDAMSCDGVAATDESVSDAMSCTGAPDGVDTTAAPSVSDAMSCTGAPDGVD